MSSPRVGVRSFRKHSSTNVGEASSVLLTAMADAEQRVRVAAESAASAFETLRVEIETVRCRFGTCAHAAQHMPELRIRPSQESKR